MDKKKAKKALAELRKRKYSNLENMPKIKNPKHKSPGKVGKEQPRKIKIYPPEVLPSRPGKCMARTQSRQWFCDLDLNHPGMSHINYELGISWNL